MSDKSDWYFGAGTIFGAIAGLIAFFGVYAMAMATPVGWLIGLLLGWIPAFAAGYVTYLVSLFIWPLYVLALVALVVALL